MSKKNIKEALNLIPNSTVTSDEFKKMHEYMESYIKKILLIGLRKAGGKYKVSDRVIRHSFIKINGSSFTKSMQLIGMPNWNILKANNEKLAKLESLVINYSCHVRNILVHGGYYPNKQDEYELLYNIDKDFIIEIENEIFKHLGMKILENTPKDFGISKGLIDNEQTLFNFLGTIRLSYPNHSNMKTIYESL